MIRALARLWQASLAGLRGTALLLVACAAGAQQASVATRDGAAMVGAAARILPPAGFVFPINQSLVYEVEWRLWNAGTATLTLTSDGKLMRVAGTANSAGVVSTLYPVHDRFQSVFDARTFCSLNLTRHTEEGFHARETLIAFNYAHNRSMLDETNLKNGQSKHQENDIPGCVTDVLSGIFYVASLPLDPDTTYTFPLNNGGPTVNISVRAEAREPVKTPAGVFNTIRVSPQASAGPLKDKGRVWLWYTDDERRIPVQMRSRMFWGTLTLRLLRIEHI